MKCLGHSQFHTYDHIKISSIRILKEIYLAFLACRRKECTSYPLASCLPSNYNTYYQQVNTNSQILKVLLRIFPYEHRSNA